MNVIKYNIFPGGAHHCITLSYDDGNTADIRLAEIFRENGLKATFHLNSGRLGVGNTVSADQIPEVYRTHEVSCHMVTHPFPTDIPDISVLEEIIEDRRVLEAACGYVVRGMSYPFGNSSSHVIDLCRTAGMEYARTTLSTKSFGLPQDFLAWHPTCHHNENVMERLENFYAFDKYGHGAIVNSSRGIMCAWQKTGGDGHDFKEAARNAAIAMRDDIKQFVTIV